MITGYFVRAKRDDRWQSLDIAELTDAELTEVFKETPPEKTKAWVIALAGWIRDNVVVES